MPITRSRNHPTRKPKKCRLTQPDQTGISANNPLPHQTKVNDKKEDRMTEYKIAYLIVERGIEPNRQTFWRPAGAAYVCRDGSLNLKLDIHPGLTFNIRNPKSNGERVEAESPDNNTGRLENTGQPEQNGADNYPNIGSSSVPAHPQTSPQTNSVRKTKKEDS